MQDASRLIFQILSDNKAWPHSAVAIPSGVFVKLQGICQAAGHIAA